MANDDTTFAADIRRYEELLAKDPSSYCFAPLSDFYRRAGRIDEALEVAQRGCELHPEYVGGYMALGRACFEKGLMRESRIALEKVVAAMPDNVLAHNLLSQIRLNADDDLAAERSEAVARDMTVKEELFEVNPFRNAAYGDAEGDEDIIELTEVVDELGFSDDGEQEEEVFVESFVESKQVVAPKAAPISTVTIAELYASQGFTDQALGIYRELLAADPGNEELMRRVAQLSGEVPSVVPSPGIAEPEPVVVEEAAVTEGAVPASEAVIARLEGWLEAIRRRRIHV